MQRSLLAIVALASAATAQFTVVIPNGTATTEGNSSNAFPWGRGTTGSLEIQTIYDSTDFTLQGVNFPIIIQGLRYRANGGATSAGGTYSSCTVDMATATVDALTPSTTFASNMGPDLTQVYSGPVTVLPVTASTPGIWAVDVPLTSNFLYDPTSGNDLVIFSHIPPPATSPITGNPGLQLDVQSTGALASRIYNSSTTVYPNTTGTIGTSHGVVVEVTYVPAQGLYAGFGSDVQGGASPLTVNFTDNSFSSDPAGVLGWAWDFDGDSVVDSTLQNPTFVYQNCGTYDVTLTVVDASHSPSTLTRTAYINTDAVAASFTYALIAPGVMQFTDTSVPTPTSWAWDFDGDNVIDDTTQNPAHFYAAACTGATVTLTANRLCGAPSTATQAIVISPSTLAAANAGGNGTTGASAGNIFDVQVINPDGVNICGVTCRPYNYAGPFTMDLYASDGSYLDLVGGVVRHQVPSAWRLIGTGTATSVGGTTTTSQLTFVPLTSNAYLPQGNFSLAVMMTFQTGSAGVCYTTGSAANWGPFADANMVISPNPTVAGGLGKYNLFGTGANSPRVFNGGFHYSTWSDDGAAGIGFAGTGCANSLGQVSALTPSGNPTVGSTLTLTADNLPLSNAIMCTGYGNTTSLFGPLPLDLTSIGAPDCFLRVSTEAVLFVAGANNQIVWNFNIPNNPAFSGQQFYNQAIVIDFAANSAGAVMSDATGMLIGN